jgi:hypothetical protein
MNNTQLRVIIEEIELHRELVKHLIDRTKIIEQFIDNGYDSTSAPRVLIEQHIENTRLFSENSQAMERLEANIKVPFKPESIGEGLHTIDNRRIIDEMIKLLENKDQTDK